MQLGLAVAWTYSGLVVFFALRSDEEEFAYGNNWKSAVLLNLNLAQILAAGVVIANILQITNWFQQKHINKILAIYLGSQFAGYQTPL